MHIYRNPLLFLVGAVVVGCQSPATSSGPPRNQVEFVVAGLLVSTCATDAHCPTGLCLNLGTDKVCTTPCGTDTDCAPAWYCATEKTLAATHKYCAPGLRVPASLRPQ